MVEGPHISEDLAFILWATLVVGLLWGLIWYKAQEKDEVEAMIDGPHHAREVLRNARKNLMPVARSEGSINQGDFLRIINDIGMVESWIDGLRDAPLLAGLTEEEEEE